MGDNNKTDNSFLGSLLILASAFLFGMSYVATKFGVSHISGFAFTGIRNIIGFFCVLPIFLILKSKNTSDSQNDTPLKNSIFPGFCCGVLLFLGLNFISLGLSYTQAGKAGFISALYIVAVPLIKLIKGDNIAKKIWLCVAFALIGLYFLTFNASFSINTGDILIIFSMLAFSFHMLAIEHFSKRVAGIHLSLLQYLFCGIISLLVVFLFEDISAFDIKGSIIPVLYSGVMATGLGFTFQTFGQKMISSERVSLILSSESVFSAIGGFIFLGEVLSSREILGAVIVLISVIFAQITPKNK